MFNPKVGGIIAISAFFISFLLGLLGRTVMPMLVIRPAVFGSVFFMLSAIISTLIGRFLPELFEENAHESEAETLPGSQVNIMEGGSDDMPPSYSAEPSQAAFGTGFMAAARPDEDDSSLGDISALTMNAGQSRVEDGGISGGMDQNTEDGYTKMEGSAGASMSSDEILPDLETMAGAFTLSSSNEEQELTDYPISAPAKKASSRGKGTEWAGDFDAKEIAAGLRTVLNMDKEG